MDPRPSPTDEIPSEWLDRLPSGAVARIREHLAAGGRRRESWLVRLGMSAADHSGVAGPANSHRSDGLAGREYSGREHSGLVQRTVTVAGAGDMAPMRSVSPEPNPNPTISPDTKTGNEADTTRFLSTGVPLLFDPTDHRGDSLEPDPEPSRILDEPPLPSPLRMAGELLKTGAAVVARAAQGENTTTSPEEQERRWSICLACDHFRASDKRCGKASGCGCWLSKKIVLAASRCPIEKWLPEGD